MYMTVCTTVTIYPTWQYDDTVMYMTVCTTVTIYPTWQYDAIVTMSERTIIV
jgi:hypothetical protein